MNLKMIRLSKPNPDNLFSNYENQLEPQYFFTSSVSKTLFENSQRTLLQISEDDILSIETALLGTDLGYPDDYLGLELIFIYDDESKEFAFDGINSSAL